MAAIGFIMILKFPSFPKRHDQFAERLLRALEQLKLVATPLDFQMNRTDLPGLGIRLPKPKSKNAKKSS